ncbi:MULTISPECIES: class I SAM-dependent methyltransferase [Streptomyces]|uniref:class I SAM-dependent methyltransferase n=1 Tax=Streptomyces TaxID=1883 RepID=UPI0011E4CA7B|nr:MULTISPECIES: class I SAM-dependent methyltransferase [Streptomyces]MCD9586778.1 class I SAM-dependent methyltransferase [Streptomyces sp. 8ZJF_21]MCM3806924.1 class I SAM-dependent methyltransferase [Streptomyces sp. DR7-3]WHX23794.1 class I SAM-dependent methyltransferase [Streptomyces sp. NA07423]
MLDAACGPGSLTQRILDTCSRARVIALDADPVQPAIDLHDAFELRGVKTWDTW